VSGVASPVTRCPWCSTCSASRQRTSRRTSSWGIARPGKPASRCSTCPPRGRRARTVRGSGSRSARAESSAWTT
jgi:hypothetical protein